MCGDVQYVARIPALPHILVCDPWEHPQRILKAILKGYLITCLGNTLGGEMLT
jgi:hypothetical protein